MNILVTGGSGFLGRSLVPALEAAGHRVLSLSSADADLTSERALHPWSREAFDQIYHLAAWTRAGDFCLHHPGEQWVINQQINTHVLAWWRERQPQAKLVCMGSSCSYDPALPVSEEHYLAGQPIPSLFTYAMTKRMLYTGLLALRQQFGLTYLCLVPSTLYGPGYHTDGRQMHFIFDLIRKIVRGKREGEPVVLWGDGHQRRELCHVDDFVRLTTTLVEKAENTLINVGAGEEHSIRDFAALICERLDYDVRAIQFDTSRYVGAVSKCLAIDRLRTYVPDLQLMPLRAGLEATIQWFVEEHEALAAGSRSGLQP
jgi:GDP-L-fucose synthase